MGQVVWVETVGSQLLGLGLGLGLGGGRVTSHSRSPDGGECGICGGVLVEMCTETPQSQRSIKIQNMLTEMLHPPASIVVRTRSLDLVRQL